MQIIGHDQRRLPPHQHRKYEVAELRNHYQEIVRRLTLGQRQKDIAVDMGLSRQQVSNIANSTIVRRRIAMMQSARDDETLIVSKKLKEMSVSAVNVLEEVMEGVDTPEAVKVKAAIDILNRTGHAPVNKIQSEVRHEHFLSSNELTELKDAYKREKALLVDAEVTDGTGDSTSKLPT